MLSHTPLLRVENIHKKFSAGSVSHTVLEGVSMEIPAKTLVGLLGESGSGKTTLARIITGQEVPDKGAVFLENAPLFSLRQRSFHQTAAIQYIFQDPYASLSSEYTVEAILKEPVKLCRRRGRKDILDPGEALEKVGLTRIKHFHRRVGELSGGQRQRLAIARALIPRPRLLICDESTSMLDTQSALSLLDLLEEISRDSGLSILFITHQTIVVRRTEILYILYRGRIVAGGATAKLLDNPTSSYARELVESMKYFEEAGAFV